jgi:C_GCAxxG_C_C family probable redox protein
MKDINTYIEQAQTDHLAGFNCAEAVLRSLMRYYGFAEEFGAAASAYGGGVGRKGEMCGALNGALIALGILQDRQDPADADLKMKTYELTRQIMDQFKAGCQSTYCRDIIGFVLADEPDPNRYSRENKAGTVCHNALATAIKAAVEALGEREE